MTPVRPSQKATPPGDRLFAMTVFIRVVEAGSFSRAAQYLGIGQPSASKQVSSLEAFYNVRLLERTTRRVRPTVDGLAFYEQAKALLAQLDDLEASTLKGARAAGGRLRISCPPALGRMFVAPLIFQYLEDHSDIAIDLDLSSRYLDPIEEGVDLAIRIGAQADSSHRVRLLAPSPRVLVASSDYLKRKGEPREPADLAAHEVLLYSYLPKPNLLKLKNRSGTVMNVRVAGRLRINNSEVLMSAVKFGLGIACLPEWSVTDALAAGQLRRLLPRWEPEGTSIYAVYAGGQRLPTRARHFLDFMAKQLRAAI